MFTVDTHYIAIEWRVRKPSPMSLLIHKYSFRLSYCRQQLRLSSTRHTLKIHFLYPALGTNTATGQSERQKDGKTLRLSRGSIYLLTITLPSDLIKIFMCGRLLRVDYVWATNFSTMLLHSGSLGSTDAYRSGRETEDLVNTTLQGFLVYEFHFIKTASYRLAPSCTTFNDHYQSN